MAVAWPSSLPSRFTQGSYSESDTENVLRSEMDVGPAKTRKRATTAPVRVTGSVILTKAQLKTWRFYYQNILQYGTVPFLMKDLTDTDREMYVVEPPSVNLASGKVVLSLTMEYIP